MDRERVSDLQWKYKDFPGCWLAETAKRVGKLTAKTTFIILTNIISDQPVV